MKKIMKSKKGFTLVEMVIVIAIIVILASVIIFAVARYLNAADAAADSVKENVSNIESAIDHAENRLGTSWT